MKIDGRYNNILGHIIPILQHLGDFLSLVYVYSFHTQIYGLQVDKTGKFCLHTWNIEEQFYCKWLLILLSRLKHQINQPLMECNLELDFQLGCKHHSEYSVFLLWNLIHLKNLKIVVKIKQVRIRHIFDLNTNSDITRKIVIYSSLCMGVHYKLVVSAFNVHSMKQTDVTMKFNQRKCICF